MQRNLGNQGSALPRRVPDSSAASSPMQMRFGRIKKMEPRRARGPLSGQFAANCFNMLASNAETSNPNFEEKTMRMHVSPSLAVSLAALFISLGGAGYSATGGNFLLGKPNVATTQTTLTASVARSLQVTNNATTAGASALGLTVKTGHPPMVVNSKTKVTNLNADLLDGLDSASLVGGRYEVTGNDVAIGTAMPNATCVEGGIDISGGKQGQAAVTAVQNHPAGLVVYSPGMSSDDIIDVILCNFTGQNLPDTTNFDFHAVVFGAPFAANAVKAGAQSQHPRALLKAKKLTVLSSQE